MVCSAPPETLRSPEGTLLLSGVDFSPEEEVLFFPDPELEVDLDLVPEVFLPPDPEVRRGEEALIPSPIPERMPLVLRGETECSDFALIWSTDSLLEEEGNMLDLPSEEVVPDLKGEFETKEFPVTCLKLELVLLGPPPVRLGAIAVGLVQSLSSPSAMVE
jgi:hypothetical protein